KEIFGPSLVLFGQGKDGGRDATYEGIPRKYERIDGYWIFQYKFHEIARVSNREAKAKVKADISKEIEKILKRPKKPDCYILITNAELYSSDFADWLDSEIKIKYGPRFKHLDFWDGRRLAPYLRDPDFSKLREEFFSEVITLSDLSLTIRSLLADTEYPREALELIRAGIHSRNFEWFNDTLKKYYNLVNELVKSELAEIIQIWLTKYPDRSRDILETLYDLYTPIDFSLDTNSYYFENHSTSIIAEILVKLTDYFKTRNDQSSLKKTRDFITTRFDLISDNSKYYFRTPPYIYTALIKLYSDLTDLNKIVNQISFQYTSRFGQIYKGYELMGGGVSQSGSEYSLIDLAIVDNFLTKVLQDNYLINSNECWSKIEEEILSRRVSKSNPSWILRATIPLLIDRLKDKETEITSKDRIVKLINLQRGIPSCSDKIFHLLRKDADKIPETILTELIEADIARYEIPTNVFVVILLFELINQGSEYAKSILLNLLESEKYLKYDLINSDTLVHFHIIKDKPDIKLEIINKLIESDVWREKAQREYSAYALNADLPRAFSGMAVELAIKKSGDLDFLNETLGSNTDDLKIKLVFESLPEIAKRFPQQSYSFIGEKLKDRNPSLYIKDSYTRSQLISVADELANHGRGEEALSIVDKFINDPDPSKNDKDEFNYHKRIEKGEEIILISSVRGRIPWVLQKLALNKKFIANSFDKLKELLDKEDNLYVIQQCIIALTEILIRKNWLQPRNKQNELHDLIFSILRNYSKYHSIQQRLVYLFVRYYDLNEDDVEEVIQKLDDTSKIAHFIIYNALDRSQIGNGQKKFNPEKFKVILKDRIKNGNDDLRREVAWNLERRLEGNKKEFDKLIEYIDVFVSSRYSQNVFISILKIIEDNLKDHYNSCKGWLNSILFKVLEFLKSPYRPKELTYGVPFEIGLPRILEEIAKTSADDYLEVVENLCELAKLDNVAIYDIKSVFEIYKVIDSKKRKKILPRLEALWEPLVRKNPRLAEIDWIN
ncbi:hypothetical protein, partial [Legionella sp.]|uniref:hypothetical protein n=1 Tax=Legionella sp. TaxID=459 RepID=UPI00322014EB